MARLMTVVTRATAILLGIAILPCSPAEAQAGTRKLVIFGNDTCPRDAICIVKPEKERYRLPKDQQLQGTRQERQSWAQKSQELMTAGNTGTGQCSAVGPGGHTGCLVKEIHQEKQDAAEQQQQNTAPAR